MFFVFCFLIIREALFSGNLSPRSPPLSYGGVRFDSHSGRGDYPPPRLEVFIRSLGLHPTTERDHQKTTCPSKKPNPQTKKPKHKANIINKHSTPPIPTLSARPLRTNSQGARSIYSSRQKRAPPLLLRFKLPPPQSFFHTFFAFDLFSRSLLEGVGTPIRCSAS